jgi:hypothetical protein
MEAGAPMTLMAKLLPAEISPELMIVVPVALMARIPA